MATFIPVWKNTQFTAQTDEFRYVLKSTTFNLDNTVKTVSCEGIASPYPDGIIRLDIEGLYRSYLMRPRSFTTNSTQHNIYVKDINGYAKCELYRLSGEAWEEEEILIGVWYFVNGVWDYQTEEIQDDIYLSRPINGRADPRMFIYATQCKPSDGGEVTPI